jgi:pimeloyl-ACP methyl ester carboxylesterase
MKLNYRVIGEGKPIIILHGFLGISDNWQSFAKSLAEHNYAVYLFDLRNHGLSGHHDVHTYESMAADVVEMIEGLDIKSPIVIGHSMGGKVAMQISINYLDLMRAMIIIDIAPYSYPVHHQKIIEGLLAVDLEKTHTRKDADLELSKYIPELSMRQFLLKNLYWEESEKLAWRFNLKALSKAIYIIGDATIPSAPIHIRSLFIYGKNSNYINPSRIHEITDAFPDAEIIGIENAGHWIHAEQPAVLLKVVLEFIEKIEN